MAAASVLPLNTLEAFRVFFWCSLIHKPGEIETFFCCFFGIQAGTHLTRSDGLQKTPSTATVSLLAWRD